MKALFLLVLSCFVKAVLAQTLAKGLIFNDAAYQKLPMKPESTRSIYVNLPKSASLKAFCPKAGNQGQYSTCVGWATSYAARTILWAKQSKMTHIDTITKQAFSPDFVYKSINKADVDCKIGMEFMPALKWLHEQGDVFQSNLKSCPEIVPQSLLAQAVPYKLGGFEPLFDMNHLDRSIELDTTFWHAYYNRGKVAYDLGDYEQAISDYEKARSLAGNDFTITDSYKAAAIAKRNKQDKSPHTLILFEPSINERGIGVKPELKDSLVVRGRVNDASGIRSVLVNQNRGECPHNDAEDMAAALKRLGFEVILHKDASIKTFKDSILSFVEQLKYYDVGLFFYAGHGFGIESTSYLLPTDFPKNATKADVEQVCISLKWLQQKMADAGSIGKTNILILDACRDDGGLRNIRSGDLNWIPSNVPTGFITCYAVPHGETTMNCNGRNGLYTSILLQYLEISGLLLEQVFNRVCRDIVKIGGKTPQILNGSTKDFYFKPY